MFTLFNEDLHQLARTLLAENRAFFARQWSQEQLVSHQLERLKRTVLYVKTHSAFYGRQLEKMSIDDVEQLTFESFALLPFTDKADLRNNMFDMLSRPVSEAWIFYETTGTTGPSTPCPRDNTDSLYTPTWHSP